MSTKEDEEPLVTIDKLEDIFAQTLGSIRGSAGLVLWCWVQYSHMSRSLWDQANLTYLAVIWCFCVLSVRAAMLLNRKLVDGFNHYKLDPKSDDLIVITGGSSGLGLLLVAMFSADGFATVNLDIAEPQITVANSQYIHCDISRPESVHTAVDTIRQLDLKPTVLINCAGAVAGTLGPFAELSEKSLLNVINTNLSGTILLTQKIIQLSSQPSQQPTLKMVAGISSSTALAGPAYASIYAASKAGLRIFFESLRHELSRTRVLCVTLGQLDTAMFSQVSTPSQLFSPVIMAADTAQSIHDFVLQGRQGEVSMPLYARLLPFVNLLPQSIVDILRDFIGIDSAALTVK